MNGQHNKKEGILFRHLLFVIYSCFFQNHFVSILHMLTQNKL